jgi:hypothetical protein
MAAVPPTFIAAGPPHAFDAFISYSHSDRDWVDKQLLPPLEQAKLRVCIDYRDFDVGLSAQENMENAVSRSRHVVLVLSACSVNSDWACFEYLLANEKDPAAKRRRLVPLLIDKIELPLRFRIVTYADFCDPANYETQMQRVIRAVTDTADAVVPTKPVDAKPVADGLDAFRILAKNPLIRTAAVRFGAIFATASEQLTDVADYKSLHDQLHELELHCYEPMTRVVQRFPGDEDAKAELDGYRINLENTVEQLHAIAQRFARADTSWIPNVDSILTDLRRALDENDSTLLMRVIKRLDRELGNRPPKVNAALNAAARALRLSDLVVALTQLRDHAAELSSDPERLREFRSGVETLDEMEKRLTALVSLHDQWQNLDECLRCMDKNPDLEDVRSCWPDVKSRVDEIRRKCAELGSLPDDAARLEQAIHAGDIAQIARKVRLLRRQVITRFFNTDSDLRKQCEQLRGIGEPLAALLKVIQ